MDALEASIGDRRSVDEDTMGVIEEKFESLVPYYQSAKNTGLTFINEANRVSLVPYIKGYNLASKAPHLITYVAKVLAQYSLKLKFTMVFFWKFLL